MNYRPLFYLACIAAGLGGAWWWVNEGNSPDSAPGVSQLGESPLPGLTNPALTQTPAGNDASAAQAESGSPDEAAATDSLLKQSGLSDQARIATSSEPPVISYNEGIMKVAPAVVSLYARARDTVSTEEASRITTSQGSGVLVDSDGIVLTNLHLIEGLDAITVVLSNGRNYAATLLGSDRETDLAVVKIPATNLPYVRLDEAPPLRVGDVVLAIGNPFGVGQTVTQGIVSATRRRIAGGSVWQNFVQIDAAINPGNSGGALINPYGQLVGVNTAVFRGESDAEGIGFSIPADLLVQVVPQIIENGSVARGWLGIGVEELSMFPDLSMKGLSGSVITSVRADSPASRGGLRPRDVVTHLGEKPISNATQLLLAVSALPPGATVKLTVLRSPDTTTMPDSNANGQFERIDLKMRLGVRPNFSELNPQ